jgi:sugar/nucleoside kinase (ribokinase family)
MKYDIITVGEILVEVLTERVNQKFSTSGTLLGPFPSGAPAIAIDQSARMGAKTTIIAKVGNDDFGMLNKNRLSENGVDISHIITDPSRTTGTAFVTYFSDGNRQFIFHFEHAACGTLCEADIDEEVIKSSRILHIMGCSITGSPSMGSAIMKAVRIAKANNVKISFDPNIRPELVKGKIMDYYREIIDDSDVLLTGNSEMKFLYSNPDQAIKDLLRLNKGRIVVIKDGSKETRVYTNTDAFSVPSFKATEVDATGAGDSFDGTFLALLCQGYSLREATIYGNAAGAKAVEKRGPMEGNCNKVVLNELLAKYPMIKPTDIIR